MKSLSLALASLLFVPFSAHAELDIFNETFNCETADRSTVLVVGTAFDGDSISIVTEGERPASAALTFKRRDGAEQPPLAPVTELKGMVAYSPKGIVYELAGNGVKLSIAAPTSKAPSELTLNGRRLEVSCF